MADKPISMLAIGLSIVPRGRMIPSSQLRRIGLSRVNRIRNSAAREVYSIRTTAGVVSGTCYRRYDKKLNRAGRRFRQELYDRPRLAGSLMPFHPQLLGQ